MMKVLKEMGKFNLIFFSGKYNWELAPVITRKLPFLSLCTDLSSKTTEVQAQPWKVGLAQEDRIWTDLLPQDKVGTAAKPKPWAQAQSKNTFK